MYADPEKGDTKVKIVKIRELLDENGKKDFTYIILVDGREKDTYADKLRPIATENYEPSAPPLTSGEHENQQRLYPTPRSQRGVVYMI